ncbi:MAG: universal stress protein [Streptococcaceae bacterium]|nr:universal stress protein [Streptococcaceae bacterium]MCL2681330.1 universal stress protein [Streptococcaceae bacterium]MCL2858757.1 universal stress protein [Streptococcaceae bacterium]
MLENYSKILVGLDGSVESTKAFDTAVATAIRNDAELVIANVIDLRAFQSISAYDTVIAEDTQKGAQHLVDDFVKEATDAGVKKITPRIEFGSPKVMLGQTLPKEENVDLIVLGATGLSYIERIFIGSVADYIIKNAPCDTLIVRDKK